MACLLLSAERMSFQRSFSRRTKRVLGGPRGRRVLVVDDEPLIASLLAEILSGDGHEVVTAPNGAVALEKLQEGFFDLILSDIRMPELDGFALYRELQKRQPDSIGRMVFITASPDDRVSESFLEEAGVPFLSKPFSMRDLYRVTQPILALA